MALENSLTSATGLKPRSRSKFRWKPNFKIKLNSAAVLSAAALSVIFSLYAKTTYALTIQKAPQKLSVSYYEPVFYSPSEIIANSNGKVKVKRSVDQIQGPTTLSSSKIKFSLSTPSRDFVVSAERDRALFHPELKVTDGSGKILDYDVDQVLSGTLEDDPDSKVEGIVNSEGFFDGAISTGEGQLFHVESAKRYFETSQKLYPGIIYEQDAVQVPPESECASSKLYAQFSNNTQFKSHRHKKSRRRREVIDPKRRTCMLYLQADHLFYKHFGSEESAINMMARHIQRVNEIYRGTDFDGDGTPDGVSFMIKRIKVHNTNDSKVAGYKYNGDFEVIKFLERFSEGDYESFCLAYMFTFRDFEGGTLGLAWTGDLKNAGGVCERKGHFRGGLKSLNTGIITLLNYGKVVLPAVSYVTLAHEIGHNFGSPHDPEVEKECVPGGTDGNFIMYARATAGDQPNNQRFSPCSLRSIRPVLSSKARNIHGCFVPPQSAICGNREVEAGEQCDCGWEEDCVESCCWPMRLNPEKGQKPCTLKPSAACSPSVGPCCTSSCTLTSGNKCREDNGCSHPAFCSGIEPTCPPSEHKPNKTICGSGSNVCFMGECSGSICVAYGLESCQCSDSNSRLCELCCKLGDKCISSFELNSPPFDVPDLFAKPGSPCKNYTGYCDAYRSCREVDPSGPLATLRNLLLADEGLSAIAQWIDQHWYAVVSVGLLLIVMMILTAKLCGKQATKKLRKMTVLHSNVEAIAVERSYYDENGAHIVQHHQPVRKKIPLRKKIRERKKSKKRGQGQTATSTALDSNNAGPSTGQNSTISNPQRKENKAPKYGTIWRKRKAAERARQSGQKKTDSSAPSAPAPEIDLVQLHTPPTTMPSSSANSAQPQSSAQAQLYPVLQTQQQPGNSNTAVATTAPSPNQPVNHHYEAKTAILPSAPGSRAKRKRFGHNC